MRPFLILLTLLLTGCAAVPTPEVLQTRASDAFELDNRSAAERATELARHITELEDIDRASVVITGNTAMVGIRLTGELDDQKLMRLKAKVEREVKRLDPGLTHVAVTASGELVQRINDLADAVADDTPPQTDPETERKLEALTPPV